MSSAFETHPAIPRAPTGFRPRLIILPLEVALEFSFEGDPAIGFIRERIARGDPGPLEVVDGVASTPAWDLEIARTGLCVVLRRRSGLEVTSGEDR